MFIFNIDNIEDLHIGLIYTFQIFVILGLTNMINNIWYVMKSLVTIDYTNSLFAVVTIYNRTLHNCNSIVDEIYEEYPLIRNGSDQISYMWKYVMAFIFQYRIEPSLSTWISVTTLYKTENEEGDALYTISEQYVDLIHDTEIRKLRQIHTTEDEYVLDVFQNIYKITSGRLNKQIVECLITLKYNDHYTYYICNSSFNDTPPSIEYDYSNAGFLSVEYTHPKMSHGIFLDLIKQDYLLNNEILSASFVKRWLEYQSEQFHFDMNYKLRIMDNNINMFELTSDQFIIMNDDAYSVEDVVQ